MGNKASAADRRHSVDVHLEDDSEETKKKNKKNKRDNSKRISQSQPVTPSKSANQKESKSLDLKIYRSTSTIEEVQRRSSGDVLTSDIRIYRRSMADSGVSCTTPVEPSAGPALSRNTASTHTLPRNFGRSAGFRNSSNAGGESQMTSSRSKQDGGATYQKDCARSSGVRSAVDDWKDSASAGSFDGKSGTAMRPPSRTSTQSGVTLSTVTADDFPDTAAIVRRLRQFECRFTDRFTALYSALPDTVQLSALSIAVHRDSAELVTLDQAAATVSLWNYLRSASQSDLPTDLPLNQFALTIPIDLFNRAAQLRQRFPATEGAINDADYARNLQTLVRDMVSFVASEAATAVATAFEYQIGLIGDGLPCQLLADRAADCAVDFLKKNNRHLDMNAVVSGVVRGRPTDYHRIATVSVFVGHQRELKWNIDEVLHRAGLRKDRLLLSANVDTVAGYGTPWQFYTSTTSPDVVDSMIYGYRGQLLHRDFAGEAPPKSGSTSTALYRLDPEEEMMYDVEVMWRQDDFHRAYRPLRRFIGIDVMETYSARTVDNALSTLADFVQSVHGEAWRRDEVQPVYRPIAPNRLRRQQFRQNGARPRCVSDAVEFSRQNAARRTWCPATAPGVGTFRERGEVHRTTPPMSARSSDIVLHSPDIFRHPPSTAPVVVGDVTKFSTLSTVTTNIVIQKSHPAVSDMANPSRSSSFVPATGARRSFMTSTTRDREPPAVQRRQMSSSSSSTSAATNTNSVVNSGFPTIDELFAKELRAMKAKTVHITDFPVFDDEQTKTTQSFDFSPSAVSGNSTSSTGIVDGSFIPRKSSGGNEGLSQCSSSLNNNESPVVVNFLPFQSHSGHRPMTSPLSPVTTSDASYRDFEVCRVTSPQSPTFADNGGYGNNGSGCMTAQSFDSGRTKTLIISNI